MSANESHGRVGGSIAWASSVFVLTLALFSFGYYADPSSRALLALTEGLAYSAHATLHGLGSPTQVHFAPHTNGQLQGYLVVGERINLRVANDCNGAWAFAIFLAAVLAVPSPWRAKVWGLGLGLPALWGVNVTRVVSLYYLGIYFPNLFEAMHLYVWQFLIIGAGLLFLATWVEVFVAAEYA